MKKLCALVIALSCAGSLAYGQLYFKGGLGYSLSLGGIEIDRDRTENTTYDHFEFIYGATGGGFEGGAAVGFAVSSSVALELGLWYEFGQSYEANDVRLNPAQNRTRKYTGTLFGFAPAVVISGEMGTLKPYARFGVLVGLPNQKLEETTPTNVITDTFSGGMLLGFHGGAGVILPLQGNLAVFVEIAFQGGSWGPTKLEEKDRNASTTTTITLKSEYNSNEPFVDTQPSIPFGNVGARAGVKVTL